MKGTSAMRAQDAGAVQASPALHSLRACAPFERSPNNLEKLG